MKIAKTILIVLVGLGSGTMHAQIKTSVTGLEAHKERKGQIKEWRKLNKEKLKQLKQERKAIIDKAEQLGKEVGADEHLGPYYEAKKYKNQYGPMADTLRSMAKKNPKDSAEREDIKKQLGNPNMTPEELEQAQGKAKRYADQYEGYDGQLTKNKQLRDSLAGTMEMMAKRHVKHPAYSDNLVQGYEDKLNAQKGQVDALAGKGEGADEEMKQRLLNRAKQLGSNPLVGKADKVEAAQQKLTKLKKKYSYVPNSNDLSTARKANSLEGEPLKKRLKIGGTLQIHAGKPVGVDFNPQIAYRIHKKWSAGVGATYRSSFGGGERFISGEEHETYGGRLFTDYTFFKSFFAHGEFEKIHTNYLDPDEDRLVGQWSSGLLVGIGKKYRLVKKVEGNVMILYNFLHDEPGPYERPWVIRFGFNWKP